MKREQYKGMDPQLPLLSIFLVLLSLLAVALLLLSSSPRHVAERSFPQCLTEVRGIPASLLTSRGSPSFVALLNSSAQNPRIDVLGSNAPTLIVTPTHESHVQSTVICAKEHGVHVRIRSGGHDYEGLSYASAVEPFVLVDLSGLRQVSVDASGGTVWVQSGATLGELYHTIAEKAGPTAAFPAGVCPTVGVGGHFSGGGFGTLVRAFGLASDQITDVRIVNAGGEILDRESMGEDHFWAVRGGGCCFGVVLSFNARLVRVPPIVTVFSLGRNLSENATSLVTEWQRVAPKLDPRLFIRVILVPDKDEKGSKTVKATFNSLFLGPKSELLPLMEVGFRELGLRESDCSEMSWIESVLYFSGYSSLGRDESSLAERGIVDPYFAPFKAKSDFAMEPISERGWENVWKWFFDDGEFLIVILDPFGGRMDEISESEAPFPHRKGTLYSLQYMVKWGISDGSGVTGKHLGWMRGFYEFMAPYVSRDPRGAYCNYRDLDLGMNGEGNATTYLAARTWGRKYFKGNFRRLAAVKSRIDPGNFFRNEQSVPPLSL